MRGYSLLKNLRYMTWVYTNPRLLIADLNEDTSWLYGAAPFLLYIAICEMGWLGAYLSGSYQAINPLPKFLPIPDDRYPLYQALFGPFVKAAGVFIFIGTYRWLMRLAGDRSANLKTLAIFYLLVSNTLAILAILVDQVIVWREWEPGMRFLLSTIHPIVFLLATAYLIWFVVKRENISLSRSLFLVLPAMILSGPLPGIFFR